MRIKLQNILLLIGVMALITSCSDIVDAFVHNDEGDIEIGEVVRFIATVPKETTRAEKTPEQTAFDAEMKKYRPVAKDYPFTVTMLKEGSPTPIEIGSAEYIVSKTQNADDTWTYNDQGFLTQPEDATTKLYWESNVVPYAFMAEAHPAPLSEDNKDQSSDASFFAADHILGYGFVPLWDSQEGDGHNKSVYDLNGPNFLTSKQWYNANKSVGIYPQGYDNEYYKAIPLYMRHQRARISIILVAGEGIERSSLVADPNNYLLPAQNNIITSILSYSDDTPLRIQPLLRSYAYDYTPNVNDDPANTVNTALYDAIIEPFEYAEGTNATDKKIAEINVSGQKFAFYAANDSKYADYLRYQAAGETAQATSVLNDIKERYNLKAGQHLVITATLSTADRKILITAYVKDWEDWAFATICDDYGMDGKPEKINNKKELMEFLKNPDLNRSGKVAIIVPPTMDLEGQIKGESDELVDNAWGKAIDNSADQNYELHATLNLAGATLYTKHPLLTEIAKTGKIVNGTIEVRDAVECAAAVANNGSIERVNVVAQNNNTSAKATRAGIAVTNTGTIYKCTSTLPVTSPDQDSEIYIGGIAAVSEYAEVANATMPVIDQCQVTARVDGGANVKGAGVVGKGTGRISNNVFEYGITLNQNPDNYKNIIHTAGTSYASDNVFNNEWCTKVKNTLDGQSEVVNARTLGLFDQVIDCQEELKKLVTGATYNVDTYRFRIANSFYVAADSWKTDGASPIAIGRQEETLGSATVGNVLFELDGNDKTITLSKGTEANAPMLFSNIQGKVHDLVVYVADDITSVHKSDNTDGIAALAYSVTGQTARLSNIKIKMASGKSITASSPASLVVWAWGGAIIEDCQSNAVVNSSVSASSQQTFFVGGLVNSAAKAKILRCTYHIASLTKTGTGGDIYVGGVVGGTSNKTSNGSTEKAELEISDCVSWLTWADNNDTFRDFGGIIGYTLHAGEGQDLDNSMKECQGNWWQATRPYAKAKDGMKEEAVIGKKNSVSPQQDTNY